MLMNEHEFYKDLKLKIARGLYLRFTRSFALIFNESQLRIKMNLGCSIQSKAFDAIHVSKLICAVIKWNLHVLK